MAITMSNIDVAVGYFTQFNTHLAKVARYTDLTADEQEGVPKLLAAAKAFEAQCVRLNITPSDTKGK
jgi:hypothetical protein